MAKTLLNIKTKKKYINIVTMELNDSIDTTDNPCPDRTKIPTLPKKCEGLRYNTGKLRYDLEPQAARREYIEVLTKGAEKYFDRNWELGMKWTSVLASLKRHIAAFESGEDYDPESGCLHMAHAMCNTAFITEYYSTYPQGDDRPHRYLNPSRIALDIDEVMADWTGSWTKRYNLKESPEFWNFDRKIREKFEQVKDDKDFWLSIPRLFEPSDLKFEPTCYVTSRSIPNEWTEEWIDLNGFPSVPVYSVGINASKVEVLINNQIDIYVDDRYKNFVEINNAGICCFLMDAPHNKRYNVGYKRLMSISELNL